MTNGLSCPLGHICANVATLSRANVGTPAQVRCANVGTPASQMCAFGHMCQTQHMVRCAQVGTRVQSGTQAKNGLSWLSARPDQCEPMSPDEM
jgi:hypothetical protein